MCTHHVACPGRNTDLFTGIVEDVGVIEDIEFLDDGAARLTVRAPAVLSDAVHGCSIAVDGTCLTVTTFTDEVFSTDVMAESLRCTTLGQLAVGSTVNLERAMRADSRFGGHVVTGHVDCVGTLLAREKSTNWEVLRFGLPLVQIAFVALKGSITVSGVSLTVSALSDTQAESWFEVSLIPTTLADTTLGALSVGAQVNIETDVLAKYVQRLLSREVAQ
jgi:riboflavin synthase